MDVPQNVTWGIRVPWTYKSPVIWKKVNWLTGLLLLIASYGMVGIGWVWPTLVPNLSSECHCGNYRDCVGLCAPFGPLDVSCVGDY
ncbi:SdpI family protein [Lactiplantibacillus plantarum]|uniref:SdpI family protein n=1 Tax=Lactiplantibacillus plantarum TaxID=1590 RepID=UPI00200DFB09|nr:SdpI family protein [Lactiplantibacillus plantarum]